MKIILIPLRSESKHVYKTNYKIDQGKSSCSLVCIIIQSVQRKTKNYMENKNVMFIQ